jgi:hypothetical protein
MKPLFICFLITLFCLNKTNAQNSNSKEFTLECSIRNDYSGYIYMEYENKKDSCLVVDNHFVFTGTLKNKITSANLYINSKTSNTQELFLERNKMFVEMAIEEKSYDDNTKITLLSIVGVKNSRTTQAGIDYAEFLKAHAEDKDLQQKLYDKVDDIVTLNPKNPLGCNIICGLSREENMDKEQLRKIYAKLNKKNQDKMLITIIEENLL